MTDISIAPLCPSASVSAVCSSSTAIATINGGVKYRSSGISDADLASMTKAMHEHRRMLTAWASMFRRSPGANGLAFQCFGCHPKDSPQHWDVNWPGLFKRASQVLGGLGHDTGKRSAVTRRDRARAIFVDAFARHLLATMLPAVSLNNN